jgi:hypothetical protein
MGKSQPIQFFFVCICNFYVFLRYISCFWITKFLMGEIVLRADVGPVRPADFAWNRLRPRLEATAAAARGPAVVGNPPVGEAERALRWIEQNFTELTRIVPMIEIEDFPPSMQTHMVGLPRTWVRLFRHLGRAVYDYNRAHRP